MNVPLVCLLAAAGSYLVGSLPFGLLTARWVAGIDIRQQGSGNIGATNVGRVVGAKWGIAVLVLDALKGLLPTLLFPLLLTEEQSANAGHVAALSGVLAILGHMFPAWLGFKGGKGVATALGVILALGWQASLVAFLVFVLAFAVFRIVSLSSMLASTAYGVTQLILLRPDPFSPEHWSLSAFSILIPLLIIFRHRANIGRLLRGEEPRFQFGKKKTEPPVSN